MNNNLKLILASTSPRRQQLLKQINQPFTVAAPAFDEGCPQGNPAVFVKQSARGKAHSIRTDKMKSGVLILAADTLVVQHDQIFGKPKNRQDARRMLSALAGRTHQVLTGVALVDPFAGKTVSWAEKTEVVMRMIGDQELKKYLESEAWKGKAGAYGIQDLAATFITKISGCYFNVVGLPLAKLSGLLHERGLR